LHREAVGELELGELTEGEWRFFDPGELMI
jgi:16S rRNA U516 pseudouridylate synthase RsuA-like enzyme